jgi:hypothetical protein
MSLNARNAENCMNPFVFVQTAKTRDRALPAGKVKAKSNCPFFHPAVPERIWILEGPQHPVHALREAAFPERVNQCSRVLQMLDKRIKK